MYYPNPKDRYKVTITNPGQFMQAATDAIRYQNVGFRAAVADEMMRYLANDHPDRDKVPSECSTEFRGFAKLADAVADKGNLHYVAGDVPASYDRETA